MFLLAYEFVCSTADSSLFIFQKTHSIIFLLVHVDDLILTRSNLILLNQFICSLGKGFAMKDLSYIHYFLGVKVAKFYHGLILHQRKYATDLLKRAKMHASKLLSTPIVPHNHPTDTSLFSDPTFYRSIVGGLQYLTFTWIDIAYSVNFVCQHMHQPSNFHFQLVKRIL